RESEAHDAAAAPPTNFNNIVPLSQHNITPQTVFYDRNHKERERRSSPHERRRSATDDKKPHTITDALLDASTTIDNDSDPRQKLRRSRSQRSNRNGEQPQT